jgi:hypothetical protein
MLINVMGAVTIAVATIAGTILSKHQSASCAAADETLRPVAPCTF